MIEPILQCKAMKWTLASENASLVFFPRYVKFGR